MARILLHNGRVIIVIEEDGRAILNAWRNMHNDVQIFPVIDGIRVTRYQMLDLSSVRDVVLADSAT